MRQPLFFFFSFIYGEPRFSLTVCRRPVNIFAITNIIEKIWRIIKSRIKAYERPLTKIEDMKAAVQAEWDKITIEDIRELIRTMPERMQQAHKRNGYGTKF